jgi:hypothetical protein
MENEMSQPRAAASLPNESRHNFYHAIHKGLRLGHCRMLAALGSHDFGNEPKTRALLEELRSLIGLGRSHLEGENREIHSALEARKPGASSHAADDHHHHELAFAELESLIRAVEAAAQGNRNRAGNALYKRYATFAAADMEHMHEEETELLSALQDAFNDDELQAIEGRIVSAIPPQKMMAYMRLMMPALNHPERVGMLSKLQSAMPPQVFDGLLAEGVKPSLERSDFEAAAKAIGFRLAA